MNQEKDQAKEFTAYFDDGTNFKFKLDKTATRDDAKQYVTIWNGLAGKKAKIDRIIG